MDDHRIKIAVLIPNLEVGGAERLVLEEISNLRNDGHFSIEVHLVFEKGALYTKLVNLGVPVRVWGAPHKPLRTLKTCWDMSRYLRSNNFDILHCHLFDHVGPYIAKIAGIKAVATVHLDARFGILIRTGLRRCDLVLACGQNVLLNISRFMREDKIRLLSNAVGPKDRRLEGTRDLAGMFSVNRDSIVVASLGRLVRQKGFDTLITAFQMLVQQIPKAVLLIGGRGDMDICLKGQIYDLNLQDNIRLLGHVERTDELLELCDVYVNSSRYEGLPMTLLDAMAHGKPIVATSVGGNSEVVRDGVTGLLVPPENPKKLYGALMKVLSDQELKEKLGAGSYNLFLEEYTIDRHCNKLANFYLQVAAGPS